MMSEPRSPAVVPDIPMYVKMADSQGYVKVGVPDSEEYIQSLADVLLSEAAPLKEWLRLALAYLRMGQVEAFVAILSEALDPEVIENYPADQRIVIVNAMAGLFIRKAIVAKDLPSRRFLLGEAHSRFASIRGIVDSETLTWVGRGMMYLLQESVDAALAQFESTIARSPSNVAAIMGKAAVYLHEGKPIHSLELYQDILRQCSNAPACVRIGVGLSAFRLSDYELAFEAFSRALQLDPCSIHALIGLSAVRANQARLQQSNSMFEESLAFTIRALKLAPNNPIALNYFADHMFYAGALDVSEEVLQKVLLSFQVAPNNDPVSLSVQSENHYQLARLAHVLGDFDRAEIHYNCARAIVPQDCRILFACSQLAIRRTDIDLAMRFLKQVQDHNPGSIDVKRILAAVYSFDGDLTLAQKHIAKAADLTWCEDPDVLLESALIHELESIDVSLKAYKDLVSYLRRNGAVVPIQIMNNLAIMYFNAGEKSTSLELLNKCIYDTQSHTEYIPTISYNLGRILEFCGETGRAISTYSEIIEHSPSYSDAYIRLAQLHARTNDIDEAQNVLATAHGHCPETVDVFLASGRIAFAIESYDLALQWFQKAQELNPSDPYTLLCIADVKYRLSQRYRKTTDEAKATLASRGLEHAKQIYCNVLVEDPSNCYAANGLGAVLAAHGHLNEAEEVFLKAREAVATIGPVYLNLALVYMKLGQYQKSQRYYEGYLKKNDQQNLGALQEMARTQLLNLDFTNSKNTLQTSILLFPDDVHSWFNLGLVCREESTKILKKSESDVTDEVLQHMIRSQERLACARKLFDVLPSSPTISRSIRKQCGEYLKLCKKLEFESNKVVSQSEHQLEKVKAKQEKRDRRVLERYQVEVVAESFDLDDTPVSYPASDLVMKPRRSENGSVDELNGEHKRKVRSILYVLETNGYRYMNSDQLT